MKWVISVILLFVFIRTDAQTLDYRKYSFGTGDGYASVLKQISRVEVEGNTTVYAGDSLLLGAKVYSLEGVSYEVKWFGPDGNVLMQGDTLVVYPVSAAESGKYYCIATDLLTKTECVSDTLEVSVENSVVIFNNIVLGASKLTFCEGSSDSLAIRSYDINTDHCARSVKAKIERGEYRITRQWWHGDTRLGTGEKCLLENITVADAGAYYCELHIQGVDGSFSGGGTSDSCLVAVKKRPDLQLEPEGEAKVIFGHVLELKASGAESYLWSNGSRESTLTVAPVEPATYSVKGYSTGGCFSEKTVNIDVVRLKLNIGNDRVIFEGETLAMQIETNADSVLWYEESSLTLAAGISNYLRSASGRLVGRGTNVTLSPTVTTTYRLDVYFNGDMTSVPFTVTVKNNYTGGYQDGYAQTCIPPRIITQQGVDDGVGCEMQEVELMVQPEGSDLQLEWQIYDRTSGAFQTYAGDDNVKGLGKNRLTFEGFEAKNNGIYRCRIFNGCGEVVSDTFVLNNKRAPMIIGELNKNQTLCQDDSRKVPLGIRVEPARNITYQWYKAPVADGAFEVCPGENKNFLELGLVPSSDGIYKVVASNACGRDSSMIDLSIITPPVIDDFSLDVNVCTGSDAQFYVQVSGKGSFNYKLVQLDPGDALNEIQSWSGSPEITLPAVTRNGLYQWVVENAGLRCGETRSEYINLRVDQPLAFLQNIPLGADTLVCSGEKGFLQVVSLQPTNSKVTYTWQKNGVPLPDQTENFLYLKPLKQEDAGIYKLVAKNKCPGIVSNELNLRVNETPQILSSPDVARAHCQGSELHLRVVASDRFKVDSIRWFLNGYKLEDRLHRFIGSDSTDISVDSMTTAHAGVYVAELYNVCGASATTPVTIDLLEKATFDYSVADYTSPMCMPEKLSVKASGPDLRYKWLYNKNPILDEFGRDAASSKTAHLDLKDIKGWDKSGIYTCHVQNSCGDDVSEAELIFSVTDTFPLTGNKRYCQGGDGVTLQLQGSLPGVSYGLYEKNRGYSDITISGDDVTPGDTLDFINVKAGVYYVESIDTMGCRMVMPGEVTVTEDPWPRKFVSSVARPVCSEDGNGDIRLAGSEKYIEYFLLRRNTETGKWDTLSRSYPGTGSALVFYHIPKGHYKVLARNPISRCEVGMDEIIDLMPHKLATIGKLKAVDMDSIHCVGTQSDVKLMYDQFEPGFVYTLKRNGVLTDKVRKYYPVVFDNVEAGIYCVTVTEPGGCSFDVGHQRVIGQPAPHVANLNGTGGIFCEEDAQPRYIELDNTQAGITYSLYRAWSEMNEVHILDTVSRDGGAMTLEVPTKEGEYYVIATDNTPKRCSVRMNGSVVLKASRFDLTLPGSNGIVKVFDENQVSLTVTPHDAVGNVQCYWRPINNLTTPNNQRTVTTIPVTEPLVLYVAATDEMGCSVEREVRVEPYGCAFKGAILDAGGAVAENEQLCRGDALYLGTRWQCGGGVTAHYRHYRYYWGNCWHSSLHEYYRCLKSEVYWTTRFFPYITTYVWYDETGTIGTSSSIRYAKKESGWVYCKMTNGLQHSGSIYGTGYNYLTWDPQQVKVYKVWVEVQKSPRVMQVDSVGLREVVLNADQVIQLNQSEPVVKYWLEYNDGDGFGPVKDQEKWGTGGMLPFLVTGNHMQWGTYRVMAEYQNEGDLGLACRREMNGRVEIQERGFKEKLELERPLCAGDTSADLRITTSTKDAVYHICRQNGAKWDTLKTWYRGTGSAIIVKDVPKGVYKAVVTVDYTDNALKGVVEVKEQPLPEPCNIRFIDNDSIYCWGTESHLALKTDCYDLGYTYSLYKNGEDAKDVRRTEPVVWNGLMDGEYQVKITNAMGCSVMSGKRTVVQKDPPNLYQLIGEGDAFCDPREQGERILTMSSTQPGVEYSFRWRPDGEVFKDTVGDGEPISIKVPLIDRQYYVLATDTATKCSREMKHDVWVQLSPLTVTADKAIVTTKCGTPAQLRITVKGAIPPVQIEWNNELYLAENQKHVQCPYTIPLLDKSVRFKVTVTDALGCVRNTEVLAECIPDEEQDPKPLPVVPDPPGEGGTLYADIFNGSCAYKLGEKITIQKYNSVSLCASVSGGLGAYSYRWSTDEGMSVQAKAISWAKLSSGYVYLEVATPDGQKARDKIWVEVVDRDTVIPVEKDPLPEGEGGPLTAQINDVSCQNAVGDTIYINEGATLGFCAFASGGLGKYYLRWSDASGLISEDRAFRGWRPAESGYIYLEVSTPEDGQVATDKVWVEINGEEILPPTPPDLDENPDPYPEPAKPLRINIMDGYCNTPVDTVKICQGKFLSLCANAAGGWGKYYIRWTDGVRTLDINRGLRVKKAESGYIYLEVMTGGDGQLTYDTVWVEVGRTPLRYRIAESGLRCILPEDPVQITLDGSEEEAIYQLEYSPSNIGYDSVTVLEGTGEPLTFNLAKAEPGFYRITARFPEGTSCRSEMFDYVEIRRAPKAFHFSGGWEYCEGALVEGVITVDSTELSATYRLFKGSTVVETKEGIGGPMEFTGRYPAGTYYMDARIGQCYTDMEGEVFVKITPKPELGLVRPSGTYCKTSGPWEISVPQSQEGLSYYLVCERYGAEAARFPAQGTPPSGLSFGMHDEEGDYHILAVNEEKGCEFIYPGPKIRYSEPQEPDWRLSKCLGQDTGSIRLIGVDTTLEYWLSYNSAPARMLEVFPGLVRLDSMPHGQYCIQAIDPETTCATPEKCDYITKQVGGYVDSIIPACGNSEVVIPIRNFDPEAMYAIALDIDVDLEMPLATLAWPDTVFYLEDLEEGTYAFVKWRNPQAGYDDNLCMNRQIFDVVPKQPPMLVPTTPVDGTVYRMCEYDSCEIRLGMLEPGVKYSLVYVSNGEATLLKETGEGVPREPIKWDTIWHPYTYPEVINGVLYTRKDSTRELIPCAWRDSLTFGNAYTREGYYEIYADNGCKTLLSSFTILHTDPPQKRQVYGDDRCIRGESDSVRVFLSQRDEDISYYLYLDDKVVDSIPYTVDPKVTYFGYQHEEGCYYVWAETSSPTCRTKLDRTVCMSVPPQVYAVEDFEKTKVLCRATDSIPVYLVNTQVGVRYCLEVNYSEVGDTVIGTGDRKLIGYANAPGFYTVVAWVGNCKERMSGGVTVRQAVAPEINVADTLRYCENSGGVQIRLEAPTADSLLYRLWDERGMLHDEQVGDPDGKGFDFLGSYEVSGMIITVENLNTGCSDTVRVKVLEDKLPELFSLKNENNGYLCENEPTTMYLENSQPEVEYRLHKLESGMLLGAKQGDGSRIELGEVSELGTYYVTAESMINRNCKVGMPDTIALQPAPEIRDFTMNTVRKYYCYVMDAAGIVELPASQPEVVYELYKEGEPTGNTRIGSGGRLEWGNLAGKSCDEIAPEDEMPDEMGFADGYHYTIVATHGESGCKKPMSGSGTIVEETDPKLWVCSPGVELRVCEGEEVHMNVSVATGCNLTYILEKNGVMIYSGKEPVYDIASMQGEDFAEYHWSVSNDCGIDRTKDAFELIPRDQVRLSRPMADRSFCGVEGEQVTLSSGFENALYTEWYKVGNPEPVSTQQMLVLRDKSEVGTYVCKAWNECNRNEPMTDTVEVTYGLPKLNIAFRRDTVCAGSQVTYAVTGPAQIDWFFNGMNLGVAGRRLQMNSVAQANEGLYSIKAANSCGDTLYEVAALYVDDTIKVVDVSPDELMCLGNSTQLFIKTSPMERVKYAWYHNTDLISTASTCNVGPFTERTSLSYTVWYSNACYAKQKVKSHTVRINVPKRIVYDNPSNVIRFCADCVTDTVLRLNTDPGMLARYEWYCRQNSQDIQRQLQDSEADTLAIRMCTRNSGFYYCRIYNKCETKTVQTCWIKVDSTPQITSPWPKEDTICKGAPHTVSISSSGGNMTYKLHILYQDGRYVVKEYPYSTFDSQCNYTFGTVTDALNGSRLWWELMNSCDTLVTDTLHLAVKPSPVLRISPLDTTVCSGEKVNIVLNLDGGRAPWEYGYKQDGGSELLTVTDIQTLCDTLEIDTTRHLEFTYIQDNNGCSIPGFSQKVDIQMNPGSSIALSCPELVCRRDTVELAVSIKGGNGPWKFSLNEYSEKNAKLMTYDFLVSNRDTVIKWVYLQPDKYSYFVQEGTFVDTYGGLNCPQDVADARVTVAIEGGGIIEWGKVYTEEADRHVGDCEVVNLYERYGISQAGGKFVITDADGIQKEVPLGILQADPGCYDVEYVYVADNGCPATMSPAKQILCVDSLPKATVVARDKSICAGAGNTMVDFDFIGAAPFTYNYVVKRYDYDQKPMGTPTYVSDQVTRLPDLSPDLSVRVNEFTGLERYVYELTYLKDVHGCPWDTTSMSDTVWFRQKIDFKVLVNDHGVWTEDCMPVYFQRGDSVEVACELLSEPPALPWRIAGEDSYSGQRFSHKMNAVRDTFKLAQSGYYEVDGNDAYGCGSWNKTECVHLYMLDSGYVKCKLLLEGPCNRDGTKMTTSIQSYLPTYGKPLPVVSQPIIDWIYIELRNEIDEKPVSVDSCLLLADGTVIGRDGKDVIAFPAAVSEETTLKFYLVFRQRNHLPVALNPVELGKSPEAPLTVDLTTGNNIYMNPAFTGNELKLHMTQVGMNANKRWALSAGEVNDNHTVTIYDPNKIAKETLNAALNYEILLYDLNFDGKIQWATEESGGLKLDWLKAKGNRDNFTEVPLENLK